MFALDNIAFANVLESVAHGATGNFLLVFAGIQLRLNVPKLSNEYELILL